MIFETGLQNLCGQIIGESFMSVGSYNMLPSYQHFHFFAIFTYNKSVHMWHTTTYYSAVALIESESEYKHNRNENDDGKKSDGDSA